MLKSKLWHSITENKNVKVANSGIYINCDQYPCKLNFDYIFNSIVLPFSAGEKYIFKKLCFGEMGNFLLLVAVMIKT